MIEKIIYRNHMNEEIRFGENGIFAEIKELHNYSWNYSSKNDFISSFNKKIKKIKIDVFIVCGSDEEGIEKRNKLFEIPEKDVLKKQHGRIIIGDYYLKCYAIESKKSEYLKSKRMMKSSLTIVTDKKWWIKEKTTTFGYGQGSEGDNLDFNNDFPYDYTSNLLGKSLNNTNFIETNFRMIIYGACENPSVTIAGHEYNVNVSLEANEYLTIDSIEKTIVLTHADGTKENCFNLRNRDSYIFEKIPVGVSGVSSGYFKFDVTLLEERSEPKWT